MNFCKIQIFIHFCLMAALLKKRKQREQEIALQSLKENTCIINHSRQVIIVKDAQFKGYYGTIVSKKADVYSVQLSAVTSYKIHQVKENNLFYLDAKLKNKKYVTVLHTNENNTYICKNINLQEQIYHQDEFEFFDCKILKNKPDTLENDIKDNINSDIKNDNSDSDESESEDNIDNDNTVEEINNNENNENNNFKETKNFKDIERITLDYTVLTREEQQYKALILSIGKNLEINTHFIDFEKLNTIIEKISDLSGDTNLNKIDLNYLIVCVFLHECIKENIILDNLEVIFNKLYTNKIFKKTDIIQTNLLKEPYNKYNDLTELHLLQKNTTHFETRIQNKSIKQLLCLVFENANYLFTDVFNIDLNRVIKTRSKFTFRSCIELKPIKNPKLSIFYMTLTAIIQELQSTNEFVNGNSISKYIENIYPNLKDVTYLGKIVDLTCIQDNFLLPILQHLEYKKNVLNKCNLSKSDIIAKRLESMSLKTF
jgi:hypothetical protein